MKFGNLLNQLIKKVWESSAVTLSPSLYRSSELFVYENPTPTGASRKSIFAADYYEHHQTCRSANKINQQEIKWKYIGWYTHFTEIFAADYYEHHQTCRSANKINQREIKWSI